MGRKVGSSMGLLRNRLRKRARLQEAKGPDRLQVYAQECPLKDTTVATTGAAALDTGRCPSVSSQRSSCDSRPLRVDQVGALTLRQVPTVCCWHSGQQVSRVFIVM